MAGNLITTEELFGAEKKVFTTEELFGKKKDKATFSTEELFGQQPQQQPQDTLLAPPMPEGFQKTSMLKPQPAPEPVAQQALEPFIKTFGREVGRDFQQFGQEFAAGLKATFAPPVLQAAAVPADYVWKEGQFEKKFTPEEWDAGQKLRMGIFAAMIGYGGVQAAKQLPNMIRQAKFNFQYKSKVVPIKELIRISKKSAYPEVYGKLSKREWKIWEQINLRGKKEFWSYMRGKQPYIETVERFGERPMPTAAAPAVSAAPGLLPQQIGKPVTTMPVPAATPMAKPIITPAPLALPTPETRYVTDAAGKRFEIKPEAVKEPWEMTRVEFFKSGKEIPGHPHIDYVRDAISEGKSIPREVLVDYPEMREEIARRPKITEPTIEYGKMIPVTEDAEYAGQDMKWTEDMTEPEQVKGDFIAYHFSDSPINAFVPKQIAMSTSATPISGHCYAIKVNKGDIVSHAVGFPIFPLKTSDTEVRMEINEGTKIQYLGEVKELWRKTDASTRPNTMHIEYEDNRIEPTFISPKTLRAKKAIDWEKERLKVQRKAELEAGVQHLAERELPGISEQPTFEEALSDEPDKVKPKFTAIMYRGEGKAKDKVYTDAQIPIAGKAGYYAFSKSEAEYFGKVNEVKVELDNPLIITKDSEWCSLTREAGWKYPNLIGLKEGEISKSADNIKKLITSKGYDGVVIKISEEGDEGKTLRRVFGIDQVISYKPKTVLEKPIGKEIAKEPVKVIREPEGVYREKLPTLYNLLKGRISKQAAATAGWDVNDMKEFGIKDFFYSKTGTGPDDIVTELIGQGYIEPAPEGVFPGDHLHDLLLRERQGETVRIDAMEKLADIEVQKAEAEYERGIEVASKEEIRRSVQKEVYNKTSEDIEKEWKDLEGIAPLKPTEQRLVEQKLPVMPKEVDYTLKGKPFTPLPELATPAQKAAAHALATKKGLKPRQYAQLKKVITGKKTMAAPKDLTKRAKMVEAGRAGVPMTKQEAAELVSGIKGVVRQRGKPPTIPRKKGVVEEDFWKGWEFKKPTIAKFISPSDRYAYSLGVYDLLKDSISAKTKMLLERQKTFDWLDRIGNKINKIGRTPLKGNVLSFVKNKPTVAKEKFYNLLNEHETAPDFLTADEKEIFNSLRDLTKNSLKRANDVRKQFGLKPIKNLEGYITHIFDIITQGELRHKYPFPEELKYILPKIRTKGVRNWTAIQRLKREEGLLKDPIRALKAMVSVDLKQIYLEAPMHLFSEQMKALGKGVPRDQLPKDLQEQLPEGISLEIIPAETRKWVEEYMKVVIKGYPTAIDKLSDETIRALGIEKALNLILQPFGRGLGTQPTKTIVNGLNKAVHDATIWARTRLVLRNWTQKGLALGLYGEKSFVKAMLPADATLKKLITDTDFHKTSKQTFLEQLPEGVLGKFEKIGYVPYGHSHISNVNHTMKVAYHAAKELVDNPKYAKLGWTEEDIMKEMEFGANTCQYWYNLMGMPEVYRSAALRPIFVLQSWWQNYFNKFWREMGCRAFTGKTGWGKPIPPNWRAGALRHIIYSLLFVEGTRRTLGWDYKRIALLGVIPTSMVAAPPAQLAWGLAEWLGGTLKGGKSGQYQAARGKRIAKWSLRAFVPGSGAYRDISQVWKGEKPASSLFFYLEKKPKTKVGRPAFLYKP